MDPGEQLKNERPLCMPPSIVEAMPPPPPAPPPPPFPKLSKFNHKREIGGTSSTDQRIMDRSHRVEMKPSCVKFNMPPVPVQAMGEQKNMHPQQFLEQSKFNHKREIGGTSSTDQRIMDRSHRVEMKPSCVKFNMPPVPVQAMGEQKNMHPQQFLEQSKIMGQSDEVSLDVNELANSLRKQLKINKAFSAACCIYRIPERLRKLNVEAYTPRVLSIGPIHHGRWNLKAMEDQKIMYLQQFLERSKVSLEGLCNVIKENETALRDCYAETISLSRKDFATMILLDAVFIIMVLLKFNCVGESYESRDHIFCRPFKINDVVFDMSLLDNQLPFFILQKLFELSSVASNPDENCTLTELTCGLFKCIWPDWVKEDSWKIIDSSGVLHFVDFLRKCQQPTEKARPAKKEAFLSAPTATELHQSGVKFKHPDKSSLLDIRFSNGILEIPQLKIFDVTEILLRNLQAFEQCHHANGDYFLNDYITFISCLVSATKDVEVLTQNGNLKNMLSSDEAVSNLFQNLIIENFISSQSFLSGVGEDLKSYCRKRMAYCKTRRHKWMATLKQVYFDNPWTVISVLAATSLLILTVIQTVCSILQLR